MTVISVSFFGNANSILLEKPSAIVCPLIIVIMGEKITTTTKLYENIIFFVEQKFVYYGNQFAVPWKLLKTENADRK